MRKELSINNINSFKDQLDEKWVKKVSKILFNKQILDVCIDSKSSNTNYNVFNVDLIGLPVESIKNTDKCWIFALTDMMRDKIAKDLNLDNFVLSNAYLAFYDKLEKANYFLEIIIENIHLDLSDRLIQYFLNNTMSECGQWKMAVNLVKKYGVVPESVMKNTYHANNPYYVNYFLEWKLKEIAIFLSKKKSLDQYDLRVLKEEKMYEIYKILSIFYGDVPTIFDFEYSIEKKHIASEVDSPYAYKDFFKQYVIDKNLSPKSFFNKYVAIDFDDYVCIANYPNLCNDYFSFISYQHINNVIEFEPTTFLNLPLYVFKYLVIKEISCNKNPVWFGCDDSWFLDRINGVWNDNLYDLKSLFNLNFDMSKEDALNLKVSSVNHSMLLVGLNIKNQDLKALNEKTFLDLDTLKDAIKSLEIKSWKAQNSWGSYNGDWGYYTLSDSWFNKFGYQAIIKKSTINNMLRKMNLKTIDEMPTKTLDPWLEMGNIGNGHNM